MNGRTRKNPGALGTAATGAKENSVDTMQYSGSHPQAQAQHLPGSAYMPGRETLSRRQGQVLAWLKECGPRGGTRLEAPPHLALSLAQRVSELRRKGHAITSQREWVGDTRVARYVLVSADDAPSAMNVGAEARP